MPVSSEEKEFLPDNVHSDLDVIEVITCPQLLSAPGKWTSLYFPPEFFLL